MEPSTPATKRRLQKCFEHATKQKQQENYDYATELFAQCVLGEPENKDYMQSFLGNLQKKYGNNKKGASFSQMQARSNRAAIKKALPTSDWAEIIKNGVVVLKINPWDVPTLTAMASAVAGLVAGENSTGGFSNCELILLKAALEQNPKDPEVNRLCGLALGKRGQFDQAIACWHRVEQARPDDEEPKRAIASLAVEKTLKIDQKDPKKLVAKQQPGGGSMGQAASAGGRGQATEAEQRQAGQENLTPEERLRRRF